MTLPATVVFISAASRLDDGDKLLFKQLGDQDHVVVTDKTVFHPQGGGQPSDTGTIKTSSSTFNVTAVRTSTTKPGVVFHLGHFNASDQEFGVGAEVEQAIDAEKRLLYSRYHTAGHVLGAAVRHLLEKEVEGFDELKASHFPDSASCEFQGSIMGSSKDAIQQKVDQYLDMDMPVVIDWWDEEEFRQKGLERLIPDRSMLLPGVTKFRVVNIVGAEVYPCGGTHVHTTKECGKTTVRKISRQKGTSRVSYNVLE